MSQLPIKWLGQGLYETTAEPITRCDEARYISLCRRGHSKKYHGQRLFELAGEPKMFLEITGTHNEGFITSGRHYEEGLDAFISECDELEP